MSGGFAVVNRFGDGYSVYVQREVLSARELIGDYENIRDAVGKAREIGELEDLYLVVDICNYLKTVKEGTLN